VPINPPTDDTVGLRTRAEIRASIYALMGWAVMAVAPPGVEAFVNEQLRLAHALLWQRFPAIRLRRWFSWTLEAGERFYARTGNDEQDVGHAEHSTAVLDAYGLVEAWLERDSSRTRLVQGLPHAALAREQSGQPTHFALHNGLELWPAPADGDSIVRVRGRCANTGLADDADLPGVPDDMVQLLALAACKRHHRHPDANDYIQMQEVLLNNLTAGSHGSQRYVPGETQAGSGYVEPVPSVPFA
jgi:hypothetical protein